MGRGGGGGGKKTTQVELPSPKEYVQILNPVSVNMILFTSLLEDAVKLNDDMLGWAGP